MKTVISQFFEFGTSFFDAKKCIILCLSFVASSVAIAQSDLSPKGRIDIQNDLEDDRKNSNKDLIFKNSGPLRDVVVSNTYVGGERVCAVEVSTSYFQAANEAKVEASIDHSDCGASNGKYAVSLKIQDKAGEIHTQKYDEVWSRADADAITVKYVYQLPGDSELLKARIKLPSKDYCTCIDG